MMGCRTFFKCDATRLVVIAHAATCQPIERILLATVNGVQFFHGRMRA